MYFFQYTCLIAVFTLEALAIYDIDEHTKVIISQLKDFTIS